MEETSEIAIRLEESAGMPVIRVGGAVSIATAAQLRRALLESWTSGRPAAIDLSGVTSADLSGLQLLYSARQTHARSGSGLVFQGIPDWLHRAAAEAGFEPLDPPRSREGR